MALVLLGLSRPKKIVALFRQVLTARSPWKALSAIAESAAIYERHVRVMALWNAALPDMLAGRRQRAVEKWVYAMQVQEQLAPNTTSFPGVRYLYGASWTAGLGHMALLDFFAKARELKLTNEEHIVLAPPDMVANQTYLDCWREWLRIETDEETIRRHDRRLREDYPAVLKVEGQWVWLHDAMAIVQRRWEAAGRKPLITLSPETIARGWSAVAKWGIPQGAWFVTVHVREHGAVSGSAAMDSVRNADISTYLDAMEVVAEAGGWVVRIGDKDVTPLPKMPQVIDYALGHDKADWLDVFLLSQARFVIATNSGPAWVAGTFGTPALLTNWAPGGIRTHYKNTVTIPQALWLVKEQRLLTEGELNDEPFAFIESAVTLERYGLISVRNSAHEIATGTRAMLNRY